MELGHFESLEIGPKTQKLAKNRQKLDRLILVFIYSCPDPLKEIHSNLLIPELRNCPRWDTKFWYKMDHHNMMKIIPPIWYWSFSGQIWPNALCVRNMTVFWGFGD